MGCANWIVSPGAMIATERCSISRTVIAMELRLAMRELIRKAKQRYFPKGIRRTTNNYVNRLIHRATRKSLVLSFSKLKIEHGSVVCVHSALSALGYLVNGPESVIHA